MRAEIMAGILPGVVLAADAIRDFLSKRIWLYLTIAAALFGMIVRVLESAGYLIYREGWVPVAFQIPEKSTWPAAAGDAIFVLLPGIFLLLMAFGSREKIGYGDGICVCMLGAWSGFWIALISMCAGMALVLGCEALYGLCRHKRIQRMENREVPFVPFLLGGYILTRVLHLT